MRSSICGLAARAATQRAARVVIGLTFALTLSAPAAAQQRDKLKKTYYVTVLGIRATNAHKEVSKELKSIAAALKKRFRYTGYKLVKRGGGRVAQGKSATTPLIEGYTVKVTPLDRTQKRVKLKIEGFRREGKKDVRKWSTVVTIDRGRYQLDLQELPGGDGLVIAVTAR